ncbi:MAG TPA: hypothetical protein VGN57_02755 [Pirellulaceae bacterium]|jgi:hypothetical protein|nr:hypothetical protein [Pirellulaceae bacterium]
MKAPSGEQIWLWSARLAPCLGLLVFFAFGWESLPPWYSPPGRVWRVEHGAAPVEALVDRDQEAPAEEVAIDRATTDADDDRSTTEESAIDPRVVAVAEEKTDAAEEPALYWLNLRSGVRHNAKCRYFDPTGDGRYCGAGEGRACRVCGG